MKSDSVDIAAVKNTAVFFTAPVTHRLHRKKPTATGFFTLAASRWRMIIGYARLSTTEQNLGLEHDDLKPAFDASVDETEARFWEQIAESIRSPRVRDPGVRRSGVPNLGAGDPTRENYAKARGTGPLSCKRRFRHAIVGGKTREVTIGFSNLAQPSIHDHLY